METVIDASKKGVYFAHLCITGDNEAEARQDLQKAIATGDLKFVDKWREKYLRAAIYVDSRLDDSNFKLFVIKSNDAEVDLRSILLSHAGKGFENCSAALSEGLKNIQAARLIENNNQFNLYPFSDPSKKNQITLYDSFANSTVDYSATRYLATSTLREIPRTLEALNLQRGITDENQPHRAYLKHSGMTMLALGQ